MQKHDLFKNTYLLAMLQGLGDVLREQCIEHIYSRREFLFGSYRFGVPHTQLHETHVQVLGLWTEERICNLCGVDGGRIRQKMGVVYREGFIPNLESCPDLMIDLPGLQSFFIF